MLDLQNQYRICIQISTAKVSSSSPAVKSPRSPHVFVEYIPHVLSLPPSHQRQMPRTGRHAERRAAAFVLRRHGGAIFGKSPWPHLIQSNFFTEAVCVYSIDRLDYIRLY